MSVTTQHHLKGLKCRDCGAEYPPIRLPACERCFAPVEAVYDYDSMDLSKSRFKDRPFTIWRYKELLPVQNPRNIVDLNSGYTPLVKCNNLGSVLGVRELYVKNDSVNPTFSFKDRPAEVAVSKAVEFGDKVVGCASTGNLAASVAAHAAKAGLPCYVLHPADIESSKLVQIASYGARLIAVKGTYDDANRLAVLASEEYGWNLVNITSRPYYVEGSKTIAFEVCEQLGWRAPEHIVIPIGSGALLCAIYRGFNQFRQLGLIGDSKVALSGAQASGCAPVARAFEAGASNVDPIEKPDTIAKSIAIGDPGDGAYVLKHVKETDGIVGGVSDSETIEAIKLLAKHEGIFTEPAGGVTIALLRKMVERGVVSKDDTVVCCVTGNGLKSIDIHSDYSSSMVEIEPTLEDLSRAAATWGG